MNYHISPPKWEDDDNIDLSFESDSGLIYCIRQDSLEPVGTGDSPQEAYEDLCIKEDKLLI